MSYTTLGKVLENLSPSFSQDTPFPMDLTMSSLPFHAGPGEERRKLTTNQDLQCPQFLAEKREYLFRAFSLKLKDRIWRINEIHQGLVSIENLDRCRGTNNPNHS
jgi:hypothetical protein